MKDKIPFYNIANMFFVGAVFSFDMCLLFINHLKSIDLNSPIFALLKDWSVIVSAILLIAMYEIGFILNRASSVLIGSLLEKIKIWPKDEYKIDVSRISKSNPKFQSMITDLVLMRTHILMYLILGVVALFSDYKWASLICIALITVFVFAGRKHNSKINEIRKATAEEKAADDEKNQEIKNFLNYTGYVKDENNDTFSD